MRAALLLHVLAAFAYVAGYTATNVLTELARRTEDTGLRDAALGFSTRFDRLLNQTGGTAVAITGVLVWWAFGYPVLTGWLLAATVLYLAVMLLGIFYWGRVGRATDRAVAAGDQTAVLRMLHDRRNVAVSRAENLAVLAIIVLMVLRPGI